MWVRGCGEEETQREEGWVESPGLGLPTERPRLEVLPEAGVGGRETPGLLSSSRAPLPLTPFIG